MSNFLARMGAERVRRLTITNAQLKRLADYATGFYATLVPKQGRGTIILPTSIAVELKAGSSALTGTADMYVVHMDDDGNLDATQIANLITGNGFINQANNAVQFATIDPTLQDDSAYCANKNLVLCLYATNYAGNTENDAVVSVQMSYIVHRAEVSII